MQLSEVTPAPKPKKNYRDPEILQSRSEEIEIALKKDMKAVIKGEYDGAWNKQLKTWWDIDYFSGKRKISV